MGAKVCTFDILLSCTCYFSNQEFPHGKSESLSPRKASCNTNATQSNLSPVLVEIAADFCQDTTRLATLMGMGMQLSGQGIRLAHCRCRFETSVRQGIFPPVNFQCRLSYRVCTSPCAITCIHTCAHFKDPIVHVRVLWIMETLKHPACTLSREARLSCSWLSLGKASQISHGRNPIGTVQL